MNKKIIISIVLIILILCVALFSKKESGSGDAGTLSYKNTTNGLSFVYPKDSVLITNSEEMKATGYFPTCNNETGFACIYFASSTYPHSNFSSSGISFNAIKTAKNESECMAVNPYERERVADTDINGIIFATFNAGDAAMSHQSSGTDFRTFHNNTCYEITTRINSSTYEVYPEGSIVKFTEEDMLTLSIKLLTIIKSVTLQ